MHRVQQVGAGQIAMNFLAPRRQHSPFLQHERGLARGMGDDEGRVDGHGSEECLQQARRKFRLADGVDQAGFQS